MRRTALSLMLLALLGCSKPQPPQGRWEGGTVTGGTLIAARVEIGADGLVKISAPDIVGDADAKPEQVQQGRDKLAADLSTSGGGWLDLNANTGLYQQDTKTLMLYGDINIFTDRGYEFHGTSADVNVNAGTVASDDKVWGQGPFGLLRANGLRVYDKGERIVFINGVHTTLFTRARG
jgi:hypothetical protein